MRIWLVGLWGGFLVLGLGVSEASAQEATPASEPASVESAAEAEAAAPEASEPEIEVGYTEPSSPKPTYDDYRREELERGAKRSRNALIGLSAAAVVGLPLWIAGGRTQCVTFDDGSGNTQTDCTTAGR